MEPEGYTFPGAKPQSAPRPADELQDDHTHINSLDSVAIHLGTAISPESSSTTSQPPPCDAPSPRLPQAAQLVGSSSEDPNPGLTKEALGARGRRLPKFGDLQDHWKHFDGEVKKEDEDLVDRFKDNLDNLLIFAGLFSAINSGFFFLSVSKLSDDPAATTNNLITLLIHTIDNSTLIPASLVPTPFQARPVDVQINSLFSVSLSLSIFAAFGSLLAQQWLISYKRLTPGATDGRRWDRERKYQKAKQWRLETVIDTALPAVLQVALLVFTAGFIVYLRDLNHPVALPNLIGAVMGAAAFVLSILAAFWDPFCPFQVPLTGSCRSALSSCLRALSICSAKWYRLSKWCELAQRKLTPFGNTVVVLEAESVIRILEHSGNTDLLLSTAANIPLLTREQLQLLAPQSDLACRRLEQLRFSADRDTDSNRAYSRAAIVLGLGNKTAYLDEHTVRANTDLSLKAATDPLSSTVSSLACAAVTHLCSHRLHLDNTVVSAPLNFISKAVKYERLRSHSDAKPLLAMVAWTVIAHAEMMKLLRGEPTSEDLETTLSIMPFSLSRFSGPNVGEIVDVTKAVYEAVFLMPNHKAQYSILSFVSRAIAAYDPEDKAIHELVLSLLSGAKILWPWDRLFMPAAEAFVRTLGSLLLKDEGRIPSGLEEIDGRWDDIVEEALLLMRSYFDSEHHALPSLAIGRSGIAVRTFATHTVTQYVRTLIRRSKLGDARWPGDRFVECIQGFRLGTSCGDEQMEFVRAVACLPRQSFSMGGRDPEWSDALYKRFQELAGAGRDPDDSN